MPQLDPASATDSSGSVARPSNGSNGPGAAAYHEARPSAKPNGVGADASAEDAYDFDRLERVVHALVTQVGSLREQVNGLRAELAERDERVRGLESQVLEADQRRQDTGKRIDELIAQLDQLDAELANQETVA